MPLATHVLRKSAISRAPRDVQALYLELGTAAADRAIALELSRWSNPGTDDAIRKARSRQADAWCDEHAGKLWQLASEWNLAELAYRALCRALARLRTNCRTKRGRLVRRAVGRKFLRRRRRTSRAGLVRAECHNVAPRYTSPPKVPKESPLCSDGSLRRNPKRPERRGNRVWISWRGGCVPWRMRGGRLRWLPSAVSDTRIEQVCGRKLSAWELERAAYARSRGLERWRERKAAAREEAERRYELSWTRTGRRVYGERREERTPKSIGEALELCSLIPGGLRC